MDVERETSFKCLPPEDFRQRFVYAIPEDEDPLTGEDETLKYLSHLRKLVWVAIGSCEADTELSPLSERVDLFKHEEAEFLREEMGISELSEGAMELTSPNYDGPTQSAIFDKFQELDFIVKLSYMNIQPEGIDLRLVCVRGYSECVIGLLTPEEIEVFIGDFDDAELI